MTNRLDKKRALVVGASSGIGRAIATAFAENGATVVVASRSVDKLSTLAEKTDSIVGAVHCDVQKTASVKEAVTDAVDQLGGIDVVINSAGVITRSDLVETEDTDMEWVIDVNLQGMLRIARATVPHLQKTGGSLILVSSQLGEVGVENASVYCATKGGINNLARQLAVEYADNDVRVNALAPGVVKTPMNETARTENDEWAEEKSEKIPLGRLATPEEITGPAVFLASDDASYITGHVLIVDGGYIAQ